jgi:AAA family ATP:ADP antiporter
MGSAMDSQARSTQQDAAHSGPPSSFSARLRRYVFPIYRHELPKFLPTFFIFFILALIYDMLRSLKSSLVVAEASIGAEVIPYIKVWAMLPAAFLFTTLYLWLASKFNREKTFYWMISLFVGFFILFLLFIYPQRIALKADFFADTMATWLPTGIRGFASMLHNWPLTLFYVFTELWGAILLSTIFWGFANEVNSLSEAKRFYPFYLMGANLAAILAGRLGVFISTRAYDPSLPYGTTAWDQSLFYFLLTAIVGGIIVMLLFRWLHWRSLVRGAPEDRALKKGEKETLALRDCFVLLRRSKQLLFIALLVLSYNIIFNLSDILWMDQLKLRFQDDVSGMMGYMSHVTSVTGTIAFFISLLVSGNILRNFGWKFTALVTPVALGLAAAAFYFFLVVGSCSWAAVFQDVVCSIDTHMILWVGAMQISVSRACKYTVFDTSKEIAYIPLTVQEQRYGKAAIDGVGSRFGKSLGSFIYHILFFCCASLSETVPYVAGIIVVIFFVWFFAIFRLAKYVE